MSVRALGRHTLSQSGLEEMLSKLQTYFDGLEHRRHRLLAELAKLEESQLGFQPAPGAWSLLDVAHHLMLVEKAVVRTGADYLRGGPMKRSLRESIGYVAVLTVLKFGVRVKTPGRSLEPQARVSLAQLEEQWEETREALKACLNQITDRTMSHTLTRHPVAGPLNAEQTLLFLRKHFDHHMRQISRIQRARGFPEPSVATEPPEASQPNGAPGAPGDP